MDARQWDAIVARVADEPYCDGSVRALLQELAKVMNRVCGHEAADFGETILANADDLINAIFHKLPPRVIIARPPKENASP